MNDDTDKPLNPVGDAALEARITAWVLGEASPFEAAELEEICARDPEARLFERRLRVLHGFITEDRKAGPEDEWKLPAEKRAKIEALFEEPVVLKEEDCEPEKVGIRYARKRVAPRQTGRRALLALAACTVISAAGWVLFSSVGESGKDSVAMQEQAEVSELKASREDRQRALEELRKAVIAQEDAVEDKRKQLSQIVRSENIIYWGDPSASQGARGFTMADDAESAAKAYVELEQEKIQLEGQIENLLRYDGPQLMNYASGLSLPDNILPVLKPQLEEAKRQYSALKSQGVAENHPTLQANAKMIEGMEKDMTEAVGNLRETLKAKLALSNEQLARLESRLDSKEEDAVKQGIANQSFVDAKGDFESSQRVLELLKQKLISEEMRLNLSDDAMAMASAEKRDFLPGGGGGGSAFKVPAPPTARPAPATQPAMPADSLAAIERGAEAKSKRGEAVDESLAKLAEDRPLASSKSSASGPPVKKPVTSYLHLSQNTPFTTKSLAAEAAEAAPTTASPTAAGGVALNEFADQRDLALGLEASSSAFDVGSANLDADGFEGYALSFGNAPADSPFDLQARFRGGGLAGNAGAPLGGPVAGGRPMEPGFASARSGGGGGLAGTIVPPASGPAEVPFFGGLFSTPQQAPAESAGLLGDNAKGGLKEDLTLQMNGYVTQGNRAGLGAINRNNIDAILNNPDRVDGEARARETGSSPIAGERGAVTQVIEGVGEVPMIDADSMPTTRFQSGTTGQATMLELPAPTNAEVAKNKGDSDGGIDLRGFDGFANKGSPITGKPSEGYNGLAQKEMIRRQNAVATSDKLRDEGREAYSKGDYKTAVDKYKASMDVLPDAPMVQDRRHYLSQVLGDGTTALGEQYRKVGKYDEARQLASDALALDANNVQAKQLRDYLDDPIRTNPALANDSTQYTDEVRRKLYVAEGNYNLGKFDDAHRTYEDVLRIDPYNKAARRGMESVAQARADYYRAAYDQTRAQLLAEVDRAWELAVPPVEAEAASSPSSTRDPRESIVIPELNFENTTVDEALDFLRVRAAELDTRVLDPAKKGVPIVLAKPVEGSKEVDPGKLRIAKLQLKGAKLGDVVKEVARASGLEVAFEDDAVVFRPGSKTPTQADLIVNLMAETAVAAEPFSTFSLHVSDASFKMAKAALDRGEVPAADSIRPEEFYNAFDYGDPAPASGEPVVCAVEQSAHPALPQRNLLRIGVKTGSQGRGGSTPLNLTLLLDSSGSMEREDRNAGLANAVKQLSGLLKEGDTVSVIGFARQPRLLVDRLPGNRAQELNAIFAQTPSEGGTNLEEGLKLGEELAMRQFNPAAQNRIVLFTDGAANLGDAKPETLQAKVEHMRQNGIAFDAAGFGTDGLNDKLLERLTRNGNGRYYIVDRAEDADASFAKQLAGAFRPAAENVKVQVRFNPARVAKYKLIGFEEHRLKKEDFRNDAVDAAEMADEEAGNALYQIEALPQGEGEVGEVSVRFRDAASGQMVERTWTIPYEAQAASFDQASPSIQLAGLAAFAAEKLRAAPMADAVDFQQLAPVMAKVKARYANSKPVADLESMIGKLK